MLVELLVFKIRRFLLVHMMPSYHFIHLVFSLAAFVSLTQAFLSINPRTTLLLHRALLSSKTEEVLPAVTGGNIPKHVFIFGLGYCGMALAASILRQFPNCIVRYLVLALTNGYSTILSIS